MFTAQAHQTETRAIAHFRMWLGGQNLAEQLRGVGPGGIGPAQQTRGRPLQILLMRFGPMFCNGGGLIGHEAAGVTGHPQTAVENLHRGRSEADVHLLAGQLVGNAVEVPLSDIPSACATGRSRSVRPAADEERVGRARRTDWRVCPGACGRVCD